MHKLSYKTLLIILFVLFIAIVVLWKFFLSDNKVSAAWWDDGWHYRQAINVDNSSGSDLTNFQVSFSIGTSALIAAGKMQSDCSDIRITDINGNSIPYWIEENNPGCNQVTNTKIWTKAPSISTSGATIYIYYGNTSTTAAQDGIQVFEFFDDFNDNDISDWTQQVGGTWVASGGTVSTTTSNGKVMTINNPSTADEPIIVNGRIRIADDTNYNDVGVGLVNTSLNGYIGVITNDNFVRINRIANGSRSSVISTASFDSSTSFWTMEYTYKGSNNHAVSLRENGIGGSVVDTTYTNLSKIALYHQNYGTSDKPVEYDWVLTRKYASTDPSLTLFSEEVGGGPIGYWKFDEGIGTTAFDSSLNEKNLNFGAGDSAPTWTNNGKSNKALFFNGSTTHLVSTSNNNAFNLINNFSLSIWIKPTVFAASDEYIMGHYYQYGIHLTSTGLFKIILRNSAGSYHYPSSGASVPLNKWTHLATTFEDGLIKFYVNGKFISSSTIPTTTLYNSANNRFNIGSYFNYGYNYNGFIDEPKVYSYVRTPAQIKQDFNSLGANSGSSVNLGSVENNLSDSLIAYWKFDEGVGTTTLDSSGNNNTATFYAGSTMPSWSTGKYGIGISFPLGSYINLGSTIVNTNAWSINTQIKYINQSRTFEFFLGNNDGNTGKILLRHNGYVSFYANNSTYYDFSTPSTTLEGNSKNITFVSNGTTISLYIDGVFQSSVTPPSTALIIKMINNGWSDSVWTANCVVDELRVYNRALSPTEVTQLYEYAPDPIAEWNFEENTGTTAFDTSGNNNHGIFAIGNSAPSWTNGKVGTALNFDGIADTVTIGNPSILNFGTNSFTYSIWVNVESSTTAYDMPFYKGGGSIGSTGFDFELGTGTWYSSLSDGTTNKVAALGNETLNQWVYLSAVIDRSTNKLYGYRDGILTSSTDITGFGSVSGTSTLILSHPSYKFKGKIDQIRIYNYARNQKQILEDMTGGILNSKTPYQHWKFDNNLENSISAGSTAFSYNGGQVSYTQNGKFQQGLDFTTLASGSFIYIDNNTLRDSTKSWTTNQWAGYQFVTDYNPGAQYCMGTITSNTSTDIVFSSTCNTFTGSKNYLIKKLLYVKGPIPNHSTSQITASLWFKSNGSQTSVRIARASNETVHLEVEGNSVSVGAISYANEVSYDTNPHDGQWHYLAVTYNGSTQKLYYDGILRTSGSLTGTLSSGGNLTIGARNDGMSEFFNGLVDEIKIYNYALSDEEIKKDYNQSSAITFGSTIQTIGATTTSLEYCLPGDTTYCASPVAEYNFEENTGTIAKDTSGNNNNGTFGTGNSAPSWASGKIGAGVNFVNPASYIDNTSISYGDNYTIETWIKPSDLSIIDGYGRTIMASSPSANYPIWLLARGNQIRAYAYSNSTGNYFQDSNYNNIQINNWYHVSLSATKNGSANLYINGILDSTFSAGPQDGFQKLTIGDLRPYRNIPFAGSIDQVKIYNYIRTPAQIAYDYNKGAPLIWLKLDECQGNIAYNSAAIGNTGSISIGPSGSQNITGTCQVGTSAAWAAGASGKYNASLNFDGNDDFVRVNTVAIGITKPFTISAWFKTSTSFAYAPGIVSLGYSPVITMRTNGTLRVWWYNGSSWPDITSTKVCNDGKWHLSTFTYDGTTAKFYIDGIFINQNISNIHSIYDYFEIGIERNSGNKIFNGQIDDARFYNYALTAEQVKTLHNNGTVNFN